MNEPGERGTPEQLHISFFDALYADFMLYGNEAIVDCRAKRPATYLNIIASLMPVQVKHTVRHLDALSPDVLRQMAEEVIEQSRVSSRIPRAPEPDRLHANLSTGLQGRRTTSGDREKT